MADTQGGQGAGGTTGEARRVGCLDRVRRLMERAATPAIIVSAVWLFFRPMLPESHVFWLTVTEISLPIPPDTPIIDQDLDDAILDACGPWGGRITAMEAARIHWIAGSLLAPQGAAAEGHDGATMASDLAQAWPPDSLTHVFCGEPTKRGLDGMHWSPRWDTTKDERWWKLAPCGRYDSDHHGITSQAIKYIVPGTNSARTAPCPKSHAPTLTATRMLELGAVAARSSAHRTCVIELEPGLVVVVAHDRGRVRTLYPRRSVGDDPRCFRPDDPQ